MLFNGVKNAKNKYQSAVGRNLWFNFELVFFGCLKLLTSIERRMIKIYSFEMCESLQM